MNTRNRGKIVAMFDRATITELVPKNAIQLLPFQPEQLNAWRKSQLDMVAFIKLVCDKDSYVVYPNKQRKKVNYRSYWRYLYKRSITRFADAAKEFATQAKNNSPVPASVVATVKVPNFRADKNFGSVAKYYCAYDTIIDSALSEEYFFCLSHLIESQQELECSLFLAERLYYKQALQVLRTFIELLVSQILFCSDSVQFTRWIKGTFKLPRLRGKGGLLESLSNAGHISNNLSERTAKTYDTLNSYIHNSEKNLIHRGLYEGQYRGHIFDPDYFEIWALSFSDIVDTGILLLDAHFEQIKKLIIQPMTCSICHTDGHWTLVRKERFAGTNYVVLKCDVCNNARTVREDSVQLVPN